MTLPSILADGLIVLNLHRSPSVQETLTALIVRSAMRKASVRLILRAMAAAPLKLSSKAVDASANSKWPYTEEALNLGTKCRPNEQIVVG